MLIVSMIVKDFGVRSSRLPLHAGFSLVGRQNRPARHEQRDQLSNPILELVSRRCFLTRTFS